MTIEVLKQVILDKIVSIDSEMRKENSDKAFDRQMNQYCILHQVVGEYLRRINVSRMGPKNDRH